MRKDKTLRAALALGALTAFALAIAATAAAAPPTNTTPPSITGTPRVGETLTAQNGTWANNPTAFQYQWQRCTADGCAAIAGAVEKTYLVTTADAGATLRVRVLAVNADGAAAARSAPTAVVQPSAAPQNTGRPTISGEATVGETLTANEGTWTNSPTSFSYQWQQCDIDRISCLPVVGATGKTYGIRAADVGFRLRVRVTATNANGSGAATSVQTVVVTPAARITNRRPTLTIISARFLGARIYARFRVCDDTRKNLTILATDSRPGVASYTRRFTTLIPPRPCGVYTRSWVPVARFRGPGRYTVTLRARDTSRLTSLPARRSFNLR